MKIKAIYLYLVGFLWAVVLVFLFKYFNLNFTGLGVTLIFLTLIFAPSIFLWRLFKFQSENISAKLLNIIGLGFGFHFLVNLLGLIFSLTLTQVIFLDLFGIAVLFLLALFYDRKTILQMDFEKWLKEQTLADWLLYIILIGGSLVAFMGVNAQSSAFVGDTYFHMAILNKITTATNLSPYNLWPIKNASLNVVYAFPIWHILVAEITKILSINIFTTYAQVLLPLTILTLLVWWGFARVFFSNKYLAGVIYLAFIGYFFSTAAFYALIPLRSPDSLNRLLIFPLLLALTGDYLFSESKKTWLNVVFLSFLAIFMGLIHFTQLIEYFLILIVFVILFMVFIREKEILKKAGLLLLVLGGTIFTYLGIFQSVTVKQFLQSNINNFTTDTFRNKSYQSTGIFNIYAVLALPFLVLFFKRNNRLIFLSTIPLVLMMITWEAFRLRPLFLKYFGEIFVTRAITDLPGYIFFGFLILFLILVTNYLFGKIHRTLQYIFYAILAVILFAIILTPFRNNFSELIDLTFFSGKNLFIYNYFWQILIILLFLSISLYIGIKYYLKKPVSILFVPKNKLNFIILTFVCFLFLSMPYYPGFFQKLSNNPSGSILSNRKLEYFGEIPIIGGEKTVRFLNGLPQESVFAVSNPYIAEIILLYARGYVAEYPYGINQFTSSASLFNPSVSLQERKKILDDYAVEYVIVLNASEEKIFSEYPEVFEKVFDNRYKYDAVSKKKGNFQKEGEFVVFKYIH